MKVRPVPSPTQLSAHRHKMSNPKRFKWMVKIYLIHKARNYNIKLMQYVIEFYGKKIKMMDAGKKLPLRESKIANQLKYYGLRIKWIKPMYYNIVSCEI